MKKDTMLIHSGRSKTGPVNQPVMRASTILFDTVAEYEATRATRFGAMRYGIHGTHSHFALEDALTQLQGCHRAVIVPSGLAATTVALLAVLKPGDHLLMVDTVYGPTRSFAEEVLRKSNIDCSFFSPAMGAEIEELLRPNTRAVYCESPGTFTFEVQDIPALASVTKRRGISLLLDNTWAGPLFFDALGHGVDISIQAATKYICGHSDVLMGTIATNEAHWLPVRETVASYGFSTSADDCYLALRGLRTLAVRMRHQHESGLAVARWLSEQPGVARVLHPGLPSDPGHALWLRDFSGASSLFGVVLATRDEARVSAFIDRLELFGIGSSWGGFESLVVPARIKRDLPQPALEGSLVRLHVGLEDRTDLIADLEQALDVLS